MEKEIDERNRASLDRLRAVAAGLSEEELLRAIDPPWTASALFAHIAFWDCFAHARWLRAADTGQSVPLPIDNDPLELVNQAGLHEWGAVPPRIAIEECLAAAEIINAFVESLDAETVSKAVRSGQERLVDRSIHRGAHLATIEQALPNQ